MQQNNNGKGLAINYLCCYRSNFPLLSDFYAGFKRSTKRGRCSSGRKWDSFIKIEGLAILCAM